MSRMDQIKKMEKFLFNGKTHKVGMDFNFIYLDEYLSEQFFGTQTPEWLISKAKEEATECRNVYNQLEHEFKHSMLQEETIHHFIEEVGDFILAGSSVLKLSNDDHEIHPEIVLVTTLIHYVNDLLIAMSDAVVNPDSVFQSNKAKIEEYYSAVRAYEELQEQNPVTENVLVKLIKRLYTRDEYTNTDNKAKIIKELRRMRFAIVNSGSSF